MPQSLPLHVLVRHVIIHIGKNLATYLRACLVVVVWLACLPSIQALEVARELELATLPANGTSPVTPFQVAPTSSASISELVEKLIGFLMPVSQTLNISGSDPLAAGLFKSLYYGLGIQSVVIPENQSDNVNITLSLMKLNPPSSPSLLGEVSFLRNFTRHAAVNDALIYIAEGYVITILVVVCFVLIFLIREWVVQQQPGINMGAGFNAEFAAGGLVRDPQPVADIRPRRNARADRAREDEETEDDEEPPRERPMARPRRRNNPLGQIGQVEERHQQERHNDPDDGPASPSQRDDAGTLTPGRPSAPRDALGPAAQIHRRLEEEPRHTEEFLAIWRRADSDPEKVLRIIEDENKSDDMRYWVNAMNVLQNPLRQDDGLRLPGSSQDEPVSESELYKTGHPATKDGAAQTENGSSSASSESWVDIRQPGETQPLPAGNISGRSDISDIGNIEDPVFGKGKGKATDEIPEHSDPAKALQSLTNLPPNHSLAETSWNDLTFTSSSSRPRAVSDGPQRKDSISPLANNNWSFSNLLDEDNQTDQAAIRVNTNLKSREDTDDESDSDLVPLNSLFGLDDQTEQATFKYVQGDISDDNEPELSNYRPPPRALTGAEITKMVESGPITVQGEDGVTRTVENIQDLFPENPVDNDPENETEEQSEGPQSDLFRPIPPLPETREPLLPPNAEVPPAEPQGPPIAPPVAPQGFLGQVADFLWGGVGDDHLDEQGENDERIVQDIAEEAPFVPVAHQHLFDEPEGQFPEQDREVVEAVIAAGLDPNDQDAIDDAEDFEGIMELVGMRGPIFSLVQNALFSAFLLALTVAFGVWIPYNIGRISLLGLANPGSTLKFPLRVIYGFAAFLQDLSLSVLGMISYIIVTICSWIIGLFYSAANGDTARGLGSAAMQLSQNSAGRIMNGTVHSLVHIADSEIFAFSAASHESLITLKTSIIDSIAGLGASVIYLFTGDYHITFSGVQSAAVDSLAYVWRLLASVPSLLARPDSWVISLEVPKRAVPLDLELSVWTGWDRFWAIFSGYSALFILGAIYVKKGSPFSTNQQGREWEATVIDLLNQAGGVIKVILIISIEMLVFPLYCGLLLDGALLPLFDNATVMSRILFTLKSPLTSLFVHWFVGTCYMFHFALFVSMCRKIMRKGVLYFIRDPDDPTFHPVRDVLERNVATQLRKIMFSALVYGALVVVCLGGVVWGLAFAFKGVLPIHWSSNEPVLEFPIDLLFYNFLMPMAVRFFKPSDGLHSMYRWWFRQCARMLRLTWFMFDEHKIDEEGYHVRRSWTGLLRGVKGDPSHPVTTKDLYEPFNNDPKLEAYFRFDGKYVRAPASDQVRIPKGVRIFMEVDSSNQRVDGKVDRSNGVHGKNSDLYKQVYIPPHFRLRIFLFILSIWLFAATTGVGITIVPLVFGRHIFGKLIPPYVRKNDVYAFSIGIYMLGSLLYCVLNLRTFTIYLRTALAINAETPHNVLRRATKITARVASIAWTYSAFLFILPTLFAFLVEFYFIVPLHTYFSADEPHIVHFVQSWTLGLLYVKLTTRLILWHRDSRPAQSLRAITRNGYLNPDAKLATRSFILPSVLALSTALVGPWLLAKTVAATALKTQEEKHFLVYRYMYPVCLGLACVGVSAWRVLGMLRKWRMMIRDEVYLIGERLHNFGDRKVVGASPGVAGVAVRRLDT
ncbi:ERAD-associated E3 ubiquitin-protein ligase [Lachnellula hyalina]|uniref:RING-type E3 ubiquitin transferase n=1 Tax=Lachnellula hyalina TaxID=1316788 RepID=A0A8H8R9E8_9HELO|nr:ERAD-associated E3 ubiquitin-protein ligase [Lachnellula hyalina]TVY30097.1 ERAD-associated E3 ubiquitin-protein ligase [Lachnellula hyalina]